MKKIAIVIGATGVVGRELVDQLAVHNAFEKVVTLTRRAVNYDHPKIFNQVIDFDQLDREEKYFRGDYLFSALGTTRNQAGSIEAQKKVDVGYQFKAAQLAVNNGVSHYLLVSSSGAHADSNSPYLKMKAELEEKIKTLPFKRTIIVRPSLLLGEREDFRLVEKVGGFILPIICRLPGLTKYRPISGKQVAGAMIKISQNSGQGVDIYSLDELHL